MRLSSKIKMLLTTVLLTICSFVAAQTSRGDKLFLEGQELQKTMTIDSQDKAIYKFKQAKVAYTSQDKKSMCDNQISICEQNKTQIRQNARPRTRNTNNTEQRNQPQSQEEQPSVRTDAQISFSTTRLDFVAKPNPDKMKNVDIRCNYDDWTLDDTPSWVRIIPSPDRKKIYVSVVEDNNTNEARSCVIIARIEDKIATLTVNQKKKSILDKARDITQ